jgi:hypothetical protein
MKLGYVALLAIGFGNPAIADPLAAFDVAEDLTRFVHAPGPLHEDGLPDYGVSFVTQGYIYPAGTLDSGVEGTNADGTPVWPDKVIGVWTCSGFTVGDGFHTTTGDVVITRQIFQFENGDILVSQGSELVDEGVPFVRVITGGTGDYAEVGPALTQVTLGMSDGFGVRIQFEIGSLEAEAPT